MMSRGARSSTLIDPATLQAPPAQPQRMSSYGAANNHPGLSRRESTNKPLLNFDDETKARPGLAPGGQMASSRSVFGVDTLWEREMKKLKEIEAAEKIAAAQREAEEARVEQKKGKKGKGRQGPATEFPSQSSLAVHNEPVEPRVSIEPPVLPAIQPPTVRRQPPPVGDDDTDSDSDVEGPVRMAKPDIAGWNATSSDEGHGPRRTTGTGLRYPSQVQKNESDEDLPLSSAVQKVIQRNLRADDSDEDKPLSIMLGRSKSPMLSINFDKLSAGNEDDDDAPLGLRASRMLPSRNGDDDDAPLGLHPEQQRRAQYHMMAQFQQQQAQQQHQQMMMQAQMTNSMFFNPMMGGFPQMPMGVPMQSPSPPPVHDAAKYGRVDQWRRDVAVEGET